MRVPLFLLRYKMMMKTKIHSDDEKQCCSELLMLHDKTKKEWQLGKTKVRQTNTYTKKYIHWLWKIIILRVIDPVLNVTTTWTTRFCPQKLNVWLSGVRALCVQSRRRVLCNTSVWRTDVCPPCVCLTHTQKDTGRRMEFEALSRHERCLWEGWRIGWRVCSKKQTKSSELIGSGSVQPFKSFLNR